jgi:hypothetical protein
VKTTFVLAAATLGFAVYGHFWSAVITWLLGTAVLAFALDGQLKREYRETLRTRDRE